MFLSVNPVRVQVCVMCYAGVFSHPLSSCPGKARIIAGAGGLCFAAAGDSPFAQTRRGNNTSCFLVIPQILKHIPGGVITR